MLNKTNQKTLRIAPSVFGLVLFWIVFCIQHQLLAEL